MDDHNSSITTEQTFQELPLLCPVGESHCAVIDHARELREEIASLTEQVRTDTLTGLYNFRHFRHTLEQEMERTRRTAQATALIMVDLDHFKQVNDTWGHEAGNQALVSTAKVLTDASRGLDILCRYGGEEFALILPATGLLSGIQVAERIRARIEAIPVMVDGKEMGLTASLGIDIYTHKQDDTPEQFVARTDKLLYRAKQSGRNCVCHGILEEGRPEAAVSKEERDLLSGFYGGEEDDTP